MTQEEKAKAYDEVLKRAKQFLGTSVAFDRFTIERIFPELKENKMEWIEKIRQELKSYLDHREVKQISESDAILQWIAWLEKQGKKEQDVRYKHLEELLAADDIYQMAMNDTMVEEARTKAIEAISKIGISQLLGIEKQGEQKSTNIVPIPDGCHAYIKNRKVYIENYTKTTPANWSNPLIDWSNPLNTK